MNNDAANPIEPPLVFATDLGDAFTKGSTRDRHQLASTLRQRPHSFIIYVTDRPIESAAGFQTVLGLPPADIVVSDLGSAVAAKRVNAGIRDVDHYLEQQWPGDDVIRDRLRPLQHIIDETPMSTRRHLAYFVHPDYDRHDVEFLISRQLSDLDVAIEHSSHADVDLVSSIAGKGNTLLRLIRALQLDPDWVVIGGHLLQDETLLGSGLRGFALPDTKPAVKQIVERRADLYVTDDVGPSGMLEGLRHFGYAAGPATPDN